MPLEFLQWVIAGGQRGAYFHGLIWKCDDKAMNRIAEMAGDRMCDSTMDSAVSSKPQANQPLAD